MSRDTGLNIVPASLMKDNMSRPANCDMEIVMKELEKVEKNELTINQRPLAHVK